MSWVPWVVAAIIAVIIIGIALVIIFVVLPSFFKIPPYVINPLTTGSVITLQDIVDRKYLTVLPANISGSLPCIGNTTSNGVALVDRSPTNNSRWVVTQIDADNGVYALQDSSQNYLASVPLSGTNCSPESIILTASIPSGNLPPCAKWVINYNPGMNGGTVSLSSFDSSQPGYINAPTNTVFACLTGLNSPPSQFILTVI